METKINIAEILKNKPKGTKLYADAFGELSIEDIYTEDTEELGITLSGKDGDELLFYNDGKYNTHGEPILVPSKSMRDWRKFAWKRGDVLVNSRGLKILFDRWANDNYTSFYAKTINLVEDAFLDTNLHTLASEKEAKFFIKCIEEKLGGKLNLETLEIEKQLEFKDGDIVVYGKSVAICRKIYKHTFCFYVSLNEMFGLLFDDEVESSEEYRFATEEEKQKLFDALAKEGKAWDAEKKQIVDLKPKIELKPFDKVLVRDGENEIWEPAFFFRNNVYNYQTVGGESRVYCIPFNKETAKLIGTTDDWEE